MVVDVVHPSIHLNHTDTQDVLSEDDRGRRTWKLTTAIFVKHSGNS